MAGEGHGRVSWNSTALESTRALPKGISAQPAELSGCCPARNMYHYFCEYKSLSGDCLLSNAFYRTIPHTVSHVMMRVCEGNTVCFSHFQ